MSVRRLGLTLALVVIACGAQARAPAFDYGHRELRED